MKKFLFPRITAQHITVIVSLLVSVCALVASTMQVFIMREQSSIMLEQQKLMNEQYKASLWARVECFFSYGNTPAHFTITLRNAGTGPALIKGVRVMHANKAYRHWTDLLKADSNFVATDTFNLSLTLLHGRTLVAGEEIIMMATDHPVYVRLLQENMDKLQIDLCYQSVYGSHYLHTRRSQNEAAVLNTQEMKICAIPEHEQILR